MSHPGPAHFLGAGITVAWQSSRSENERGTVALGSSAVTLVAPGLFEGQNKQLPLCSSASRWLTFNCPQVFPLPLKCPHFAPQPGQGPYRIPVRGNLAVSERDHYETGCRCMSGSRKQQPWLGRVIPFLAPDTSLVTEPPAKDHIQSLDSFLRWGKSICHKTAGLSSEKSTKATKPEPCPAQSSETLFATTATHPRTKLL